MSDLKTTRHITCPHCESRYLVTITESHFAAANEWLDVDCPKCGQFLLTEDAINIKVEPDAT